MESMQTVTNNRAAELEERLAHAGFRHTIRKQALARFAGVCTRTIERDEERGLLSRLGGSGPVRYLRSEAARYLAENRD